MPGARGFRIGRGGAEPGGGRGGRKKGLQIDCKPRDGDPAATRTQDRLLRRQMLYPAELPDPFASAKLII